MQRTLTFVNLPGTPLRDYYLRFRVEETVQGVGEECSHCGVIGNTIACNIHAVDLDGRRVYDESCLSCALTVLDRVLDVDPAHTITLEVSHQ